MRKLLILCVAVAMFAAGCSGPAAAPTMGGIAAGAEAENQVLRASLRQAVTGVLCDYDALGLKGRGIPVVTILGRDESVVFVPEGRRSGNTTSLSSDMRIGRRAAYRVQAAEMVRRYDLQEIRSIGREFGPYPYVGTVWVAVFDEARASAPQEWEEPAPPTPRGYRVGGAEDGTVIPDPSSSRFPVFGNSRGAGRELLPLPPAPTEPARDLPARVLAMAEAAKRECLAARPQPRPAELRELKFGYSNTAAAWVPLGPSTPVRSSVP